MQTRTIDFNKNRAYLLKPFYFEKENCPYRTGGSKQCLHWLPLESAVFYTSIIMQKYCLFGAQRSVFKTWILEFIVIPAFISLILPLKRSLEAARLCSFASEKTDTQIYFDHVIYFGRHIEIK